MHWLYIVAAIAAGYVASIYTWPWVRVVATGAEAEARRLRARIDKVRASFN